MAICRDNYGFGRVQAVNKTHLHWAWKLTGVGTPKPGVWEAACEANRSSETCLDGPLPPMSSAPAAGHVDELWIIRDPSRPGGNPTHGPRNYDAPRTAQSVLDAGTFEEYVPTPGSTFRRLYDANRAEWKPDGCGELAPDPLGAECSP